MTHHEGSFAKLQPCAFGLAWGILWGLSLVVSVLLASCCNWGNGFINLLAGVYPGFGLGFFGALAGLFWGFVDGFVGGFLIAWLYNCCCKCGKCCSFSCKCESKS